MDLKLYRIEDGVITSPIRADETPAGPAEEEAPRAVPPRQKGQPSARERLRLWPRVRWCKGCGHLTDGTYVASPGPRRGALCGPGCFRHCETEAELRAAVAAESGASR